MRNIANRAIKGLAAAAVLAAFPLGAQAATTWTFNYGANCVSGGATYNNCYGEDFSRTYTGSDGSNVLIQGIANNGGSDAAGTLKLATVDVWDGIGVQPQYESSASPDHSTDNSGPVEAVLFDFGAGNSIALSEVTLGWTYNDSDISVLAYVPQAGDPASAAIADAASGQSSYVSLGASYNDLTSQGWTFIGNYNNIGSNTQAINGGEVTSRYWLIGAANPLFGGTSGYKDYFKIAAVGGTFSNGCNGDCGGSVPVPGTLMLFGIVGMGAAGRRYLRARG